MQNWCAMPCITGWLILGDDLFPTLFFDELPDLANAFRARLTPARILIDKLVQTAVLKIC